MDFWQGFWLITGIHLLAAVSPGPDFVFVSQQTLSRGRAAGLLCALGVGLGFGVHVLYAAFGLAVLVASSAWLLTAVKIVGGAYRIWLGWQGLRAQPAGEVAEIRAARADGSLLNTVWKGFLCNVLNPKAPVYVVSLYTVVLSSDMPVWQLGVYGVWMMTLLFAWFAAVAFLLSVPGVNRRFRQAGHWLDRILGAVMVALGVKVLSS